MKVDITRINNFHMKASNEEGNSLDMDSAMEIGGTAKGMRPMQLLLAAVGGCSAIDVLLILKKQHQKIDSFAVEVDGDTERVEEHKLFKTICIHFKLTGNIHFEKAERAVKLSLDKFCSVAKILEPTAKISYTLTVNNVTGKEITNRSKK